MAVEISVLTGKRHGDNFHTDSARFSVGATSDCDFCFDPVVDEGARDRKITFELREAGWFLVNEGKGEVLLNNRAASGSVHMKSGDVVRLSTQGPDLAFRIVSRRPKEHEPLAPLSREPQTPIQSSQEQGHAAIPRLNWSRGRIAVAVGLAIVFSFIAIMWNKLGAEREVSLVEPSVASLPVATGNVATNQDGAASEPTATAPAVGNDDSEKPVVPAAVESTRPAVAPADPPATAPSEDQGIGPTSKSTDTFNATVYLLAVEKPEADTSWTFASGCAIAPDTLLTSANVVAELERFKKQGWKIWAVNDPAGFKTEIDTCLVHAGYMKAAGEPQERIYFDVGLLRVSSKLPAVATLATPDELAQLQPGLPVNCVGIPREAESITRFDSYLPESIPAKIFVVTTLPPPPGPRLLHLKAQFPVKPYGSVVATTDGHVCGVYAESAPIPAESEPPLNIHYAPVIDPSLIQVGLSSAPNAVWVPPIVTDAAKSPPSD